MVLLSAGFGRGSYRVAEAFGRLLEVAQRGGSARVPAKAQRVSQDGQRSELEVPPRDGRTDGGSRLPLHP